jgi:hypothetical protein
MSRTMADRTQQHKDFSVIIVEKCPLLSGCVGVRFVKPDQVPAGFFAGAFCDFAGAGGGVGARSIDTKRPPSKR